MRISSSQKSRDDLPGPHPKSYRPTGAARVGSSSFRCGALSIVGSPMACALLLSGVAGRWLVSLTVLTRRVFVVNFARQGC
jgi:hypothetical protein